MPIRRVFVDCYLDGKVIFTAEYGEPYTAVAPPTPTPDEQLRSWTKDQLTNMKIAGPPYAGITFRVRR